MSTNENMVKLRELTEKLPIMDFAQFNNVISYMVEKGVCLGHGLMKESNVSVQAAFATKGTTFPRHTHDVVEVVFITSGKARVEINGEKITKKAPHAFVFKAKQPHTFHFLEDTWMIGIVGENSNEYPNAPKWKWLEKRNV